MAHHLSSRSAYRLLGSLLLLIGLVAYRPIAAESGLPTGTKSIYLKDNKQAEYFIGTIAFTPAPDGTTGYRLKIDTEKFSDFFLSMKEMKCLQGKEIWCFIPYPYQHPQEVSAEDLRWLEHDLLFMFKTPAEFGANLWNGIYYDMAVEDGVIRGTARAVDLNRISAPPDDLNTPPYGEFDIDDLEPSTRWLPYIEIR